MGAISPKVPQQSKMTIVYNNILYTESTEKCMHTSGKKTLHKYFNTKHIEIS